MSNTCCSARNSTRRRCRERFNRCGSVRNFSFRFCPRTMAGLPSIPSANFWMKAVKNLWASMETSVLTSATLAVGGGFDYIRQRLGLDHARELIVASHFDYERQAILYVPPGLPDPRTPEFAAAATGLVRRLIEITRGRAFLLL